MRRRAGFTIIELLVSMALIVFIMAILAEAFVEGLKTFRNMKAVGDMNARLRTVQAMLRDDLGADHFEGKRRTSDPGFWQEGPPQEGFFRLWHGSPIGSPSKTFFREGSPDGIPSYYATDHFIHFTSKKRGNDRKDFYTAAVPTNSPLTAVPPLVPLGDPDSRYQDGGNGNALATYNSQWAEIAWFLRPNGASANGTPLYTLYRRQRVIVPSTVRKDLVDLNYQWPGTAPVKSDYLEVSTSLTRNGNLYFNSPRDLTIPQRRFGIVQDFTGTVSPLYTLAPYRKLTDLTPRYPIFALSSPNYTSPNYLVGDEDGTAAFGVGGKGDPTQSSEGADVILTDVVSFAIIPFFNGTPTENIVWPPPPSGAVPPPPSVQNKWFAPGVGVYDTWSNYADDTYDYTLWDNRDFNPADPNPPKTLVPCKQTMTGVQISIRVWDEKSKQTRQITVVQDL